MDQSPSLKTLSTLIGQAKSEDAGWPAVLTEILGIMGCATGTIHVLDENTQLLKLIASEGIPDVLMPKIESIPIGKGIAGAAAERREAVQLCNLQTDTTGTARPDAKKTKVAGSLAIPILDGDQLRGTVGVGMRDPHEFTDEESSTLWNISRLLAPVIR